MLTRTAQAAARNSVWRTSVRHGPASPCLSRPLTTRLSRYIRDSSTEASSKVQLAKSGITHLKDRTLIRISGADASRFLQGLTTNNVDTARTTGWYTAFLNATGRVHVDAFVWPLLLSDVKQGDSWGCLLDVPKEEATALRMYMRKHRLRSKVEVRELEGLDVWTAWNNTSEETEEEYRPPKLDGESIASPAMMTDPRIPHFATRFITATDTQITNTDIPSRFGSLPPATDDQYRLHRYMNGVAEAPHEISAYHYQAHPSNLDILNAIDFRKGCYVGQELTIRTEHTGVVRKRILPIQIYHASDPAPSSLIYRPDAADASIIPFETKIAAVGGKREAGKFITSLGNVGLGMCRLESMTDLKISAEGGPYTPETVFAFGDTGGKVDGDFRVKAFVPDWMRSRIKTPKTPRG